MAHEQFSWAVVKLPKTFIEDSWHHGLFLAPIIVGAVMGAGRLATNVVNPEKTLLMIFFGFLIIALGISINYYWHRIRVALGSTVTTYDLDNTDLTIDNHKLLLSGLDRASTLTTIKLKLKPDAQWQRDHQPDGKPLLLTVIFGGTPIVLKFPSDYDQQRLLRALSQYLEG